MIAILEEIARNPSNASARIQAVRQLREMREDSDGSEIRDPNLYSEFEIRRKGRIAA